VDHDGVAGTAEGRRLAEDARRAKNWKRWGPYLSERQWGTVREDYSAEGESWNYFSHEQARSRAYRWGEDGLLGICDRQCRLCFALALWNGHDPILKERLFGLTNGEGNHGEDVKEYYFYLESTPTHSYLKALYKYPQAEYPYRQLIEENRRRGPREPEYELTDTGVFALNRYFDVFAEYAKADPNDLCIRITVANRGPQAASLVVLPTLWFKNSWSWGRQGEGYWPKPHLWRLEEATVGAAHATLGEFVLRAEGASEVIFTENETNAQRLFGAENPGPYVKDAFHAWVVEGKGEAVNPEQHGTKAAFVYRLEVPAGGEAVIRLRLHPRVAAVPEPFGAEFEAIFERRRAEADEYDAALSEGLTDSDLRRIVRQARAGLFWSKQFYHYGLADWLAGDPNSPPPGRSGRNRDWSPQLYNRDVLSVPDKWEYPWYATWDLAFHMVAVAEADPEFAKRQLVLILREWYMHPNGALPAYEFNFSDVNPPVHAWACWRVYEIGGSRDRFFLERVFQKLLLNFTWWVNRKDAAGLNVFQGGFLGMDNIGVFDRSRPLPTGGRLQQADATAWMAFYCATMLSMALELARENRAYEDVASKFFEHFVAIADAMNNLGGSGLWDEEDGFYYDQLQLCECPNVPDEPPIPLKVRSLVGLVPLLAVSVLDREMVTGLDGFTRRKHWFLENRQDLARHISWMPEADGSHPRALLAIPSRERLTRVLARLLDEAEFFSPYGVRSLSRAHREQPYSFWVLGEEYRVDYEPAESSSELFGGNSNWRGPVWFPLNFLLVEALHQYHRFWGDDFTVECPTGSGRWLNLAQVATELSRRLGGLFVPDASGWAPWHGASRCFADDPHWRELTLFHEYFDGDTGRGLGASHQTGWTALVARLLLDASRDSAVEALPGGSAAWHTSIPCPD